MVSDTTGVSVCVDSTPRQRAAVVVPSVCPRRRDRERQWSRRRTVGPRDGVTSMYPIANHIILDFGVLVFGDMGMLDESRGFRVLKWFFYTHMNK